MILLSFYLILSSRLRGVRASMSVAMWHSRLFLQAFTQSSEPGYVVYIYYTTSLQRSSQKKYHVRLLHPRETGPIMKLSTVRQ